MCVCVHVYVHVYVHMYVHSQDYTPNLADCQLCHSNYLPVERKQVG